MEDIDSETMEEALDLAQQRSEEKEEWDEFVSIKVTGEIEVSEAAMQQYFHDVDQVAIFVNNEAICFQPTEDAEYAFEVVEDSSGGRILSRSMRQGLEDVLRDEPVKLPVTKAGSLIFAHRDQEL